MSNKKFPRIYSLSTVGIRNHYNSDYRFHPFRTDFAGDSGVGKSIIADVLQLILVGEGNLNLPQIQVQSGKQEVNH